MPVVRSYDVTFCEVLAEGVPQFMEQAGKSKPLIVFYKGGHEIGRINEANGVWPHAAYYSPLPFRACCETRLRPS